MSLSDTLAELDQWAALAQQHQALQNQVPPQGSPQRPKINLVPPPPLQQTAPKKSLFDRASELFTGIGKAVQDPNTYSGIGGGLVRAPGQNALGINLRDEEDKAGGQW